MDTRVAQARFEVFLGAVTDGIDFTTTTSRDSFIPILGRSYAGSVCGRQGLGAGGRERNKKTHADMEIKRASGS